LAKPVKEKGPKSTAWLFPAIVIAMSASAPSRRADLRTGAEMARFWFAIFMVKGCLVMLKALSEA
jgi:hypothetical protein